MSRTAKPTSLTLDAIWFWVSTHATRNECRHACATLLLERITRKESHYHSNWNLCVSVILLCVLLCLAFSRLSHRTKPRARRIFLMAINALYLYRYICMFLQIYIVYVYVYVYISVTCHVENVLQ